ncbi:MAG: PadR family transcriptional regulator [Acidimicrobiia bacterium]
MQAPEPRSQMVKGLVDLAVLNVLSHGESYGYEILSWFEKAGLDDVGHASLYGSLKRLEGDGSVTTTERPSPLGPARRYYALSPAGEERRQSLRSAWVGLQDSLRMLEDGL